ncbi:hypothetical protein PG984_002441 [Apiospora sp. TS-2023a]
MRDVLLHHARGPGRHLHQRGVRHQRHVRPDVPVPPELMPTTSAEEHPSPSSATELAVSPINSGDSNNDKTQSTSPATGAIVGAIVGGIILLGLASLAFVLLQKRRRQQRREQQQITKDLISAPSPTTNEKNGGGGGLRTRLRLSTIPEQPASPMLSRYKSARRSYGPDWPLGSADPLESHPVLPLATSAPVSAAGSAVDLERRLSEPRGPGGGTNANQVQIPQLQIPTVPVTRLAPAPPPKSPISGGGGGVSPSQQRQQQQPPSPKGLLLQSPHLSFAPPASPIDAAFNAEVDRRVSVIDGATAASATPPAPSGATTTAVASGNSSNRNSSINNNPRRESSNNIRISTKPPPRNSTYQDPGTVSPIEHSPVSENQNPKRLSLVSAPSQRNSRFIEAADDLVSPVSPDDDDDDDDDTLVGKRGGDSGRVSPATVSPMESRRGSLDQ